MAWLVVYSLMIGAVLLAIAARIARASLERRRAPGDDFARIPLAIDLEGATPFVCGTCGAFLISRTGPGVVTMRCTRCGCIARAEATPTPVPLPGRDAARTLAIGGGACGPTIASVR